MRRIKAFINAFFVSNPWRLHARDARGKELPVCPLPGYLFPHRQPDVFAQIRKSLIDAGYRRNLGPPAYVSFFFAALTLGLLVFFWRAASGGRMPKYFLLFFGFMALLHLFLGLTRRYRVPKAPDWVIADAFLFEKHCPSCAFSLADSPASETGSTICPECGAHWNLPASPSA